MFGTLYIVATPIGNLGDITYRAIEVLKDADLVLTEDTRVTAKLLSHYDIKSSIKTYNQHSSDSKKQEILDLLFQGKNICLVTDAGTPGVSDPGNELIDFILEREKDVKIVPIPGASSVTAALSVCGFDVSKFAFIGFWPKKKTRKTLTMIKTLSSPVVFFESPYRILKTLLLLKENFPDGEIFVGQELTKLHERVVRDSIGSVLTELEKERENLGRVKGELVVVLKV